MQMLACLASLKYGAGMSCVPSELPPITSRHWSTLASESQKKLYNKTCIVLKTYDFTTQCDLHHQILGLCTHLMSYGVCYMGESWFWQMAHIMMHGSFTLSFSFFLTSGLRTRTPRFDPLSKSPKRKTMHLHCFAPNSWPSKKNLSKLCCLYKCQLASVIGGSRNKITFSWL